VSESTYFFSLFESDHTKDVGEAKQTTHDEMIVVPQIPNIK